MTSFWQKELPKTGKIGYLAVFDSFLAKKGSNVIRFQVNLAPSGVFPYPQPPGGRIPPLLSRESMVVSSPAGRRLKALHEFYPKHTLDFRIDLNPRVKVRSNVKF